MADPLALFPLLLRTKAAFAEWIASFDSLATAGETIDVSKATAGRLVNGQSEPELRTFLAACVHERDRNGFSSLFDGLADDFRGVKSEGKPLEVERDASQAISDFATTIQQLNQALSDGRVDHEEAGKLDEQLAFVQRHLTAMRGDLQARVLAARRTVGGH